jgi:16S rRNA G966 N2-methylase RsmD
MSNLLRHGDNFDVLRRHVRDETINLVYLDPPFKPSQDYNVSFTEKKGKGWAGSAAEPERCPMAKEGSGL